MSGYNFSNIRSLCNQKNDLQARNCKYQKSTSNVHVVTSYIKPYEIKYKRIVCRKLIFEIISSTVRVVLFSLKYQQ